MRWLSLIIVQTRQAAPAPPPVRPADAATAPLREGAEGEVNEASKASPVNSYRGDGKAALPASNLAYKVKGYWDERFQVEEDYDVSPSLYPLFRRTVACCVENSVVENSRLRFSYK